jgi:histone acetyltransferase (RNA polymerase elongator complex component)
MCDEVLLATKRGHDARCAEAACKLIKERGFCLVGQMMIGLPESDVHKEIYTAKKICELGADGARIYPTVTFYGTELADMAECGEYKMLDLEDAIYRSKEVLKIFNANGVECIRIGLCASDNLGDLEKVKGGANHPALGELVRGEIYYDSLRAMFAGMDKNNSIAGKSFKALVARGELSLAIGQKQRNKERIMREFGIKELKFSETAHSVGITVFEE